MHQPFEFETFIDGAACVCLFVLAALEKVKSFDFKPLNFRSRSWLSVSEPFSGNKDSKLQEAGT